MRMSVGDGTCRRVSAASPPRTRSSSAAPGVRAAGRRAAPGRATFDYSPGDTANLEAPAARGGTAAAKGEQASPVL